MAREVPYALLAAASMLATAAASAAPVTGDRFEYTNVQTGYYSIHPMDLAPDSNDAADSFLNSWSAAGLSTLETRSCFNTGMHLPQGAIMQSVQIWYSSGPVTDAFAQLYRNDLNTGASDVLLQLDTSDDTSLRISSTVVLSGPMRQIKNAIYTYGLGVCVGSDSVFYGARIRYTYTNAGD